jgi:hypothetical protein
MTLDERIAQLEEEVAYLRRELGVARDRQLELALRSRYGLTHGQAATLAVLYSRCNRPVTVAVLDHALRSKKGSADFEPRTETYLRTMVFQMRKRLPAGAIQSAGFGSGGYVLGAPFRAELDVLLLPAERCAA